MTYDQENFLVHPQTMHALTTIWKLLAINGIMSLHMNIFIASHVNLADLKIRNTLSQYEN
jgi:hypothetical protein